ncbi:DnaJ domain-containing protein [Sulfurovum sp. zt1-1]|uniref:DnaJ domain-containing protein n=1 Tax=Sulfurovum zhangzhouensis TaxID=3019067 RepID=A0ABT7QWP2_9BACT|nr:DnaJ domain-containing protein [Sulfurovum zhangzhouensis]MDM5271213.1 DnaJ domain-containing protein [Sulfurovum zhangzhouensis]
MLSPIDEIESALETLGLPKLITKADIKKQYRFLAQKHHPDKGGDASNMEQINHAYNLLMKYIEDFRYTFDENEIKKQYPGVDYVQRFRP